MGFLDGLKESLGIDSPAEKAAKKAKDAAVAAIEARAEADKAAAQGDKDAAQLRAKADEVAAKAAKAKADAEQAAKDAAAPAPAKVPEVNVAPAPDYTKSVPSQERDVERADRAERSAAPAPKAAKADEKPKYKTYTVKSGDTLSGIGAKFGVSYQAIAKLNQIKNPDLIFPGQKFKIPND